VGARSELAELVTIVHELLCYWEDSREFPEDHRMSTIKLPKDDDRDRRADELRQEASFYKYNTDIGLPLIDKEGPADKNQPDWLAKIFRALMEIRVNLQEIYDKSGFQFQTEKPVRDIPKLMSMLREGGNPQDYFSPDLGFIKSGEGRSQATSIQDYIDKVFMTRDRIGFGRSSVPEIAGKWDSDKTFAYTFVAGANPNQLQRYRSEAIPPDMDLRGFDLGSIPGFDGDRIETAIGAGRVYFVDHTDMKELFANLPGAPAPNAAPRTFHGENSGDYKYIYNPIIAFAVPPDGSHMLPIAIRCGEKSDGHELYTPKDGYSWKLARACALAAHNNHHEVITHLGLTHLLIDPIALSTRLNLHPTHPVYKLLHPHFEGTASINIGARTSLILPERSVDRLVGSKIEMNYPYIAKKRLGHSFRGNFLKERFKTRGVADGRLLPNYPYRDDALLIWDAIEAWVSTYVGLWYGSDAKTVRDDYELQNWANEIKDKGKVLDFGATNGGIADQHDLVGLLTMIIFTAGPQHAAVNFTQGTDQIHIPSNPMAGYAPAPRGREHTEKDLLALLPPLDVAIHTWAILGLLAGVNNTRLGDYRGGFLGHLEVERAIARFVANLAVVEAKILAANIVRRRVYGLAYTHLLPTRIPASINI
jgi:arachidonate 15-lipoxygenase